MRFNAGQEEVLKVTLHDDQGNMVERESFSAIKGVNYAHLHLPYERMKPGTYYLVCVLDNKRETHKIIKP